MYRENSGMGDVIVIEPDDFKSQMRLFVFHFVILPLEKAGIPLKNNKADALVL